MSYSSDAMLDGGSLASHSSQNFGICSSLVPHHKRSCHGCFGRLDAQESAIAVSNPLAAQVHTYCRQEFSSSVYQVVAGATEVSSTKSISSVGKN